MDLLSGPDCLKYAEFACPDCLKHAAFSGPEFLNVPSFLVLTVLHVPNSPDRSLSTEGAEGPWSG